METPSPQQQRSSEEHCAMLKSKKHQLLNKFLTKTFHMIDSCDPTVATWNDDGMSFIIHDVAAFADNILPLYFKHSKFASFVRQLNFYSFRKIRAEPDFKISVKTNQNNTVQFIHEFFRKGRPDLLHKINRVTKSQEPAPTELKSLKDEIASLHQEIADITQAFDQRMQTVLAAVEADYQQRMNSIALSYQTLSALSGQILASPGSSQSTVHSSISPLRERSKSQVSPAVRAPTTTTALENLVTRDSRMSMATVGSTINLTISPLESVESSRMPSSVTTAKSWTPYVTDGSSTSSREDSSANERVSPPPPQPPNTALSLLSGIASAMMQEMET
ncbi:HSF-type DNA-binding protein [Nitzschia inconspicua]|uniref:HSF-type DNA-binding protein n=1 Tax=Nitzschia inconspicua TaxID=303405 RepID=A0A9K3LXL2_9STRA|nr:HSF-type DNA-binding protein [Nitzschia inconspicua]